MALEPGALWIQLTESCAPACRLCRSERAPRSLATARVVRVLDGAAAIGVTRVVLIGGEPLHHEALEPVLRAARDRDLLVELVTTGHRVESRRQLLSYYAPVIARLWVEAHAGREETSDALRCFPGGWRHASAAAAIALEAGIELGVRLVPVARGLDQVDLWASWARRLGASVAAIDDATAHLPEFRRGKALARSEADGELLARARSRARHALGVVPLIAPAAIEAVVSADGELLGRPAGLRFGKAVARPAVAVERLRSALA